MSKKLAKTIKNKNFLHYFILGIILSLAAYLRFSHLNWDQGLTLHPDERNIIAAVAKLDWPKQINPDFYAYNGFPLFLLDISSQIVACLSRNLAYLTNWEKISLIARFHSALFSLISVYFFYLVSRQIFKKKTALISAFLATTTVSFIQHAHYGVTESLLVFELLILTYLSIRFLKTKKQKFFLLMAIALGFSIGTKSSALAFSLIPFVSILMTHKLKLETMSKLFVFLIITSLVFCLVSPNTIQHLNEFLVSMKYEGAVVSGRQAIFYTMQFINTTPYLFQIKNLFWQTSLATMILAAFGLYFFLKNKSTYQLLWPFFIFSLSYFIYVGSWYAKFNRYMIPFIPFLILLASLALDRLEKYKLYKITLTIILLINFAWALSFLQIFKKEHTRITASYWIQNNLADQNTILIEEWDERLPLIINSDINFQQQVLRLYRADTQEKFTTLAKQLEEGNYLIIASRRLYKSIPRSPQHPHTKQYYQLLFDEKLGYKQVAQFNSYPNLFGIEVKDDGAEETFRVFDHPNIFIFKNTAQLSSEEIFEKIFK